MRKFTLFFSLLIFTNPNIGWVKLRAAQNKIAYVHTKANGKPNIYVADGNGNNPKQLTDDAAFDQFPAWSPDGNYIAFLSGGRLYVMNAEGGERKLISPFADWRAGWSPDGRQLAVMDANLAIWIFDLETGEKREIPETGVGMLPAWSPDGSQIAFRSDQNHIGNWEIYLIDIDGRNLQRLTNSPGDDRFPAWSPDGRKLVFSSDRKGDSQIYVMDITRGNEIRQLTKSPFSGRGPAWSPDGDRIAFAGMKNNQLESVGIYVVDAKGGKPELLIPGGSSPTWCCPPTRFATDVREKLPTTWGTIKKGY